jgi:hypothetical protein
MKNLTLRIDEAVLAEARKQAALKGTTVAKLVREFLAAVVAESEQDRTAAQTARCELVELSERSKSGLGDWKWNRDEIYEERLARFLGENSGSRGFAEAAPHEERDVKEMVAEQEPTLEQMTTDTGEPPAPGHDAWFRQQVQLALDDKKSGEAVYEDFEKVAAEFGFNAR